MPGTPTVQANEIAVESLCEALVHRLVGGGATDLQVTAHPLWIIGHAPSGGCFQVLRERGQEAYYVSRWTADEETVEVLGYFPDWEVAVDHALHA